jgi:hypothetical protein
MLGQSFITFTLVGQNKHENVIETFWSDGVCAGKKEEQAESLIIVDSVARGNSYASQSSFAYLNFSEIPR